MAGVLLITGGARGIGAAAARQAAAAGYAVAVNYREQADAAEALAAEIERGGGKAVAVQADVAEETQVERLFAAVDAQLGPLAALVTSAGINGGKGPVTGFRGADLTRLFAVNVVGVMLCCREAVRRMQQSGGGAIVNVSSMAATTGGRPGSAHYAASKAAVDTFSMGLAREVAADGIRVNVVRPGMTATDMTADRLDDPATAAAIAATIPMQRVARAEEIAAPILWLLSDAASFVTGAFINASGGGFVLGGPPPAARAS